jgi:hypothetical protein
MKANEPASVSQITEFARCRLPAVGGVWRAIQDAVLREVIGHGLPPVHLPLPGIS